ncbi:hypothetical protein [Rhizobium rhizogenes]|uniref:hypothetical protein n=1 Tax=Rhizobium rhizogenes TaxID=359 RepID=UPI0004DAA6F9|nr:hypothetical protein [Rhizobium rhizogenes]KEA07170.1 hypothetical protein CN09_09555 [Rhizobium rhizogenes]NTI80386.1 hypothetical protein [Rhizobium rhizogenes]NTJ22572.1 hypothetical protein [Rhizobium rhizogenes]QUE81278.1 hypothetical protein EML492_05580 [Rhizobium rhizogenes]TQO80622.1 hypothetical protein FFE80_05840 [Rhizobium rhizogenes]
MADIVERLRWWGAKKRAPKSMPTLPADCAEGAAEIERLRANLDLRTSNPADYRYWEGRYRDEKAENERLLKALEEIRDAHPAGTSWSTMTDGTWREALRDLQRIARLALASHSGGPSA